MVEPLRLVLLREPRPKRKGPVEFSIPVALARADEILAGPCAGHLPRVAGRGALVARFAIPLSLLPTQNQTAQAVYARGAAKGATFAVGALKEKLFRMMSIQALAVRPTPLPGRPQLRVVRFSSVEADQLNDSFKFAIDLLRVPRPPRWDQKKRAFVGGRKGLGFLVDDAPRYVEIASWWERARPGCGMGILEVWSGQ